MKRRPNRAGQITKEGYRRISTPDGRRMLEHRYIVEKIIGRPLFPSEKIHHKDENKLNNSLSNLEITTQSNHIKQYHNKIWKLRKLDELTILDWSSYQPPSFRFKYHKIKNCAIKHCLRQAVSWGLCRRHATSYQRHKIK